MTGTGHDDHGLDAPLGAFLGTRTASALTAAFGHRVARDLLLHVPRRYLEKGEMTSLTDLRQGEVVTVMGRVKKVNVRRMRNRKGSVVDVVVGDDRQTLRLTFFNKPWLDKIMRPGRTGLFAGQVSEYHGELQLTHPLHLMIPDLDSEDPEAAELFASRMLPVYPATSALPSWRIAGAVQRVMSQIEWSLVVDPIDEITRRRFHLVGFEDALRLAHAPRSVRDHERAFRRLRWDEALAVQLALAVRRESSGRHPAIARPPTSKGLVASLDARLPFALTDGQKVVASVIESELKLPSPMQRLLQGEVGCGKTVVALRAMLQVVDAGGQAALLAPTEVLAGQHLGSLRRLMGPLAERGLLGGSAAGTRLALVTGSLSVAQRRRTLEEIASGDAGIVIGTHALLEEGVEFRDLGLIVVDEQHRFGVEQRARLRAKGPTGARPHVLVMTATPIPRTVAMTAFGDLEVSTLRDLPSTRAGYDTHVVVGTEQPGHLARTWARIREEVAAGHKAFIVCPKIDAGSADAVAGVGGVVSDDGSAGTRRGTLTGEGGQGRPWPSSVVEMVDQLEAGPLSGLRLGILHGGMAASDKEAAMSRFAGDPKAHDGIDVLISTTVIEVGVDVPNATVMVIVDAECFGISQLHQLRGRVGRGERRGLCLLLTGSTRGSSSRRRIERVAAESDGFALASLDLARRHEGDVLGASQSGRHTSLRMLSLLRDEEIISQARELATEMVGSDPGLRNHEVLVTEVGRLLPDEAELWLERT